MCLVTLQSLALLLQAWAQHVCALSIQHLTSAASTSDAGPADGDRSSLQAMRPVEDAWLVSASLGLLDGSCSEALSSLLGWRSPVPVNVAAVQLLALSSMHSQACLVLLPVPVVDL